VKRAAFLDRDGVINRKPPEGQYVTRWEEMHFLPGVAEAIAMLGEAGFRVIVVTNQRCVAKGLLTGPELELIHQRMCGELTASGAVIDEVYYCPHEEEPRCSCRKPATGMLLTAARAHQIDLTASWMIGDSDRDIEAGRKAGCRTARILKGDQVASGVADVSAQSLFNAVEKILWLES
jgi:D-glycero-D-manno-heptose 1,7-bisphosphate phosphatase